MSKTEKILIDFEDIASKLFLLWFVVQLIYLFIFDVLMLDTAQQNYVIFIISVLNTAISFVLLKIAVANYNELKICNYLQKKDGGA